MILLMQISGCLQCDKDNYLIYEAECLSDIKNKKTVSQFSYPDLLYWPLQEACYRVKDCRNS